jgi:hypothetical protein
MLCPLISIYLPYLGYKLLSSSLLDTFNNLILEFRVSISKVAYDRTH